MAVSYIANAIVGGNPTTSLSITLPTTAANDILILEFVHRGTGNGTLGGTYSGPAFALKHSQLFSSSAFSGKTYYSRATGDHVGQTVTVTGLTNSCAGFVTVYRGALASGDPLADATIVGEQNASGDEAQAAITTATDGSWIVLVVVNSPDLAVASQAAASGPTLVERAAKLSTGGTDSSIAHASGEKTTAGSTGTLSWAQINAASGSWAYAIRPASGPTILEGDGSSSGLADSSVSGVAQWNSVGASIGVASDTIVSGVTISVDASTDGSGTPTYVGSATWVSEGSSNSSATVIADGEDIGGFTPADGNATGLASATIIGVIIGAAVTSSDGLSTAAAEAIAFQASVVESLGNTTSNFTGGSIVSSIASADGLGLSVWLTAHILGADAISEISSGVTPFIISD